MGLLDDAIKEHLELKRRRGADAGEITRLESEALGPVSRSADGVPDLSDTFVPPPDVEPSAAGVAEPAEVAPPPTAWEDRGEPSPDAPAYEQPAPAYEIPPITPPPPAAALPPVMPTPAYAAPPVVAPATREPWMTAPEPEFEAEPEPEPEPEPPESGGLLSRFRVGRKSKAERARASDTPAASEPTLHEGHERPLPEPPAYELPPPVYNAPAQPVQYDPDIVPADDEPEVEDLLEETPEFLEETPEHDRLWFEQRPPRDFDFDK